jgi:predicted SnoaL-like aldol condensation-catalyzing enzyme
MTDPERSKQTVIAYLDTAFNDKQPAEAVENYGGSHYIQHNPQAPDGFEAFIQFVEALLSSSPS